MVGSAEPNKGAFFWLGLGGSVARLEMKLPASEADGGGTGGSSRGQEKWRLQRGAAGAPGELEICQGKTPGPSCLQP